MAQNQTEDALDLLLGANTALADAAEALAAAQDAFADATLELVEGSR